MIAIRAALRAAGLTMAFCLLGAGVAAAASVPVTRSVAEGAIPVQQVNTDAQIYLLRGLANVFSRGMDEMGARLQGHGFSPHILNHRGWQNAADTIAQNYRNGRTAPIILIGHSLGANAVFRIAQRLQSQNIPVAYLATFDPTRSLKVPSNVRFFVNFYQNNGQGRRASFPPSRTEEKVNLNLTTSPGLTHTNMDQSKRLQDIVIGRILEVTARR